MIIEAEATRVMGQGISCYRTQGIAYVSYMYLICIKRVQDSCHRTIVFNIATNVIIAMNR